MGHRIVVFRALQLGDMLCAVPALRTLRGGFPEARIVLIGLPWAAELPGRYPRYLDGFIPFPGWAGLPEQPPDPGRLPEFWGRVAAERWDLAIQLHGSGSISNRIVTGIPARRTVGFGLSGLGWLDEGHEIHRLQRLTDHLGLRWQGDGLEFALGEDDRDDSTALLAAAGIAGTPYAVLHPGGRSGARWPAERFARVATALVDRGLSVVVTGSSAETPLGRIVARHAHRSIVDLTSRTGLGALGALLAGAKLLVSNDTGVAHLAAALRVPSVVLFTSGQLDRWAPLDRARHRVLAPMDRVPVRAVLEAVDSLGAPAVAAAAGER